MAMGEVGSEMADSVDYVVASEELVPGLGWPYDKFLEKWVAKPMAPTAEISGYLVDEYFKYLGPTNEITMSAFQTSSFPLLWEGIHALTNALSKLSDEELLALRSKTSSAVAFAYADYVDIGNWITKAESYHSASMDWAALTAAHDALRKVMVANKVTNKYAGAEGLAFWVPAKATHSTHVARYEKLRFAVETRWNEIVRRLVSLPLCKLFPGGQWVSEVTAFSSQYGETGWAAKQVIGACDTGEYGDHNTAWAPKENHDTDEYITVGFATPVHASGAVIRETFGNGFVTRVEAIDAAGGLHPVWQGDDTSPSGGIADFQVSWPATSYLVKGLKISTTTRKHPGTWPEIDSIQLLGNP